MGAHPVLNARAIATPAFLAGGSNDAVVCSACLFERQRCARRRGAALPRQDVAMRNAFLETGLGQGSPGR
eukprot:6409363-Pyramimonas_sp.AAC.1